MEPSFYFVRDSRFSELPRPPTYSSPNISWVFKSMQRSRGGTGGPDPPEILKAIKLLNDVSLAGRCWPAFSGIWILCPLKIYCQCCRVGPPLTKLSGSAHEKNQYIDNLMQNRQAHFSSVSECVDQTCRKCVYLYVLNVLLNVFFRIKGSELLGVQFMYRLNAKFALGQNVPDSFTNRSLLLVLF